MYILKTEKQKLYFKEAMRLHFEEGYGTERIEKVLPVGHTTVGRWIAIFAREKGLILSEEAEMRETQKKPAKMAESQDEARMESEATDVKAPEAEIKELKAKLLKAEVKAEAYDYMITLAEQKFGIQIRKKSGAKQ